MSKTKRYIALLRGINVGGHNKIKMADLRSLLESMGLSKVQTYLASGNVIFEAGEVDKKELVEKIEATIEARQSFKPSILLLTLEELQQAVQRNPFPEAINNPKSLHLGFLASPENPDIQKLQKLKKDNECFKLIDKVFYLHAPDGVGRSKLAAGSEKVLGVFMTDRNWRTTQKVIEMAEKVDQ